MEQELWPELVLVTDEEENDTLVDQGKDATQVQNGLKDFISGRRWWWHKQHRYVLQVSCFLPFQEQESTSFPNGKFRLEWVSCYLLIHGTDYSYKTVLLRKIWIYIFNYSFTLIMVTEKLCLLFQFPSYISVELILNQIVERKL